MGKGFPVFAFPGWPVSSLCFVPLASLLSDKVRIIAIDYPGLGGGTPRLEVNTFADLVAVVEGFVSSFDFTEFGYLGYSLGAFVTLNLLQDQAKTPKKIVFISGAYDGRGIVEDKHFGPYFELYKRQRKIFKSLTLLKIQAFLFLMVRLPLEKGYTNGKGSKLFKALFNELKKLDTYFAIDLLLDLGNVSLFPYKKSPKPLIICTDDDLVASSDQSPELAKHFDTALNVLSNSTHAHILLEPEKSAKLILDYILA